jgi:FlaA1/EpsC-like NDP-sugar epimerase
LFFRGTQCAVIRYHGPVRGHIQARGLGCRGLSQPCCGVYGVLFAAVYTVYGVTSVPRTVGILQPLLMFGYVAVTRLMVRLLLGDLYRAILRRRKLPGLLIYGAGHAGRMLAAAVRAGHGYRLVGFLDDDPQLQHRFIDSQPVYPVANIEELLARHQIQEVMLAMPSVAQGHGARLLVEMLRPFRVRVRTLPNLDRLAIGSTGPDRCARP